MAMWILFSMGGYILCLNVFVAGSLDIAIVKRNKLIFYLFFYYIILYK